MRLFRDNGVIRILKRNAKTNPNVPNTPYYSNSYRKAYDALSCREDSVENESVLILELESSRNLKAT